MTTYIINSRKHGEQVFTVSDNGGYVRLNGKQICDGGKMLGSTVSVSRGEYLEAAAKKWWKSFLRNQREFS